MRTRRLSGSAVGFSAVEVASVRGERTVPIREFFTGPKRNVLAPDELIRAVTVPVATAMRARRGSAS